MAAYRINGFDQIKAFYSSVFNCEHDFTPQHISLYVFLINQNNRNNWVEWFKCPFDLGMAGSCIGSKSTYYKCLDDLQIWGFIEYEKGINEWKAPKIKIAVLNCTATDTATVPASEPVPIPLEVTYINNKPTTENQKPLDAYSLFVQKFNEVRESKFSNKDQKAKKQFSERLRSGYTEDQILTAVKNLMKDPFHIESGFKYLTPEFMTRSDKIEKGLNTISATQAKKANNPR